MHATIPSVRMHESNPVGKKTEAVPYSSMINVADLVNWVTCSFCKLIALPLLLLC